MAKEIVKIRVKGYAGPGWEIECSGPCKWVENTIKRYIPKVKGLLCVGENPNKKGGDRMELEFLSVEQMCKRLKLFNEGIDTLIKEMETKILYRVGEINRPKVKEKKVRKNKIPSLPVIEMERAFRDPDPIEEVKTKRKRRTKKEIAESKLPEKSNFYKDE